MEHIPIDLSDEWEPMPHRIGPGAVEIELLPEPVIVVGDDGPRIDWRPPTWPDTLPGIPA